jgi:DNA-binding protein H-NS
MPNFSKMTVDALIAARTTIDDLLKKRVPRARRELEERLNALSNFVGGQGRNARKLKSKSAGGSKLKGRSVPPKYRGPDGETWSGRGMKPRWLSAAMKGGAELEDFAIASGGRKKKGAKGKRGKKRVSARPSATKRKAAKPAKRKVAREVAVATPVEEAAA